MTTPTQIRAIEHLSKTRRTDLRRRYNQNLLRGGMAADKDTKIVPPKNGARRTIGIITRRGVGQSNHRRSAGLC